MGRRSWANSPRKRAPSAGPVPKPAFNIERQWSHRPKLYVFQASSRAAVVADGKLLCQRRKALVEAVEVASMRLASANINRPFKCLADGRLRFLGFLLGLVGNRHEWDATKILNRDPNP